MWLGQPVIMKKDTVSFRKLSLVLRLARCISKRLNVFCCSRNAFALRCLLMKFLDFFRSAAFQRRKRKKNDNRCLVKTENETLDFTPVTSKSTHCEI